MDKMLEWQLYFEEKLWYLRFLLMINKLVAVFRFPGLNPPHRISQDNSQGYFALVESPLLS